MTSVHAALRKALILGVASTTGFIGIQAAAHADDQAPQVRVRYAATQLNDAAEHNGSMHACAALPTRSVSSSTTNSFMPSR